MLLFGWSPLVLLFPNPPVPVLILRWLYRARQLKLVLPSPSFSLFSSNTLGIVIGKLTAIDIDITLIFHSFSFQSRFTYLSISSLCFIFTQWSTGMKKYTWWHFFRVKHHYIWSSGWDKVIRLYVKIPGKCIRLILEDGFWFVHVPYPTIYIYIYVCVCVFIHYRLIKQG